MRRFALIALMLALTPHSARAYTRFAFQNSSGAVIEFGFSAMTIPFQIDAGGTGVAGADAQTLIATAFSLWNNVATSDLNLTISGNTSADITATNVRTVLDPFLGPQLDGLDPTTNEVILDADGSILNQFYGGTPGLLGIAFPQTDEATGRIKTTNTVIFVTNMNLTTAGGRNQFISVVTHEIGHCVGFAHSTTAPDDPASATDKIANMFPFIYSDSQPPKIDDVGLVSSVYPSNAAATALGRVTGAVRDAKGNGIFGAVVELFSTADLANPVIGVLSGHGRTPGAFTYQIDGVPAGTYYARIESIDTNFERARIGGIYETAAATVTEEVHLVAKNFAAGKAITVGAGQTVSNINFGLTPITKAEKIPEGEAYPSPFLPHQGGVVNLRFPDLYPLRQFRVYTIDHRLVVSRPVDGGAANATWDGRSSSGDFVGSGIYFYELDAVNGKQARGKFTLVR